MRERKVREVLGFLIHFSSGSAEAGRRGRASVFSNRFVESRANHSPGLLPARGQFGLSGPHRSRRGGDEAVNGGTR